jgi:sodium/hydrogen antiporter
MLPLATTLVFGGLALLALALTDRAVRRLPLSPALIYLALGAVLGAVFGVPDVGQWQSYAGALTIGFEAAVLVSLVAVGLRLSIAPKWSHWRAAVMLAGPTMLVFIGVCAATAVVLLGTNWPVALLLASILAPTDPILASEVQIEHESDRDTVRVAITAEAGLNDGTALPAVMGALALAGLHDGSAWWWRDVLWPIGGGALLGLALAALLSRALRARHRDGDTLPRHELFYAGLVLLCLGLAHATSTSAFVVAFVAAASLAVPATAEPHALGPRLQAFGGSVERLIEAVAVIAVGAALTGTPWSGLHLSMALLVVLALRPLSMIVAGPRRGLSKTQRRLVGWFGIRGIGSLFYLAFALSYPVDSEAARTLVSVTLLAIALSIIVHGVSATPLMRAYRERRPAEVK